MAETSESREYGTILTTSGNDYMTKVVDNISKANVMLHVLSQKGLKKTRDGGERIEIPVRMRRSTSGKWYRDSDLLDTNPANPLTKSWWEWNQIAYSIVLSGLEEFKNSGLGRMIPLVQALFDDAEDSMSEDLNDAMYGSPTYLGKQIDGLMNIVPEDPTSATLGRYGDGKIGAIDQTTNTWWRNKVQGNGGTVFTWVPSITTGVSPTAWDNMEKLYENCSKGGGARNKREPNLAVSNQLFYQNYMLGMVGQKRYRSKDLADAGFKNIMYNDVPISWDEACVTESASSNNVSACYFLNRHFLHWVVGKGKDFKKTPFMRPANQDARIAQIMLIANLVTSARRKLGVVVDADITNRT